MFKKLYIHVLKILNNTNSNIKKIAVNEYNFGLLIIKKFI